MGSPKAILCGAGGGLVAKPCPKLCGPMDCSPPGSSVHGFFPGKNTGVAVTAQSPALQAAYLPLNQQESPKHFDDLFANTYERELKQVLNYTISNLNRN